MYGYILEKIFNNEVGICLEGKQINEVNIIKELISFVSDTVYSGYEKHQTGFVFHTGSECYDAVIFVCAYLAAVLKNDYSSEDMINSLECDDIVLYKPTGSTKSARYRFVCVEKNETGKRVVLKKDGTVWNRILLPESEWHNIKKYNGKSVKTDGRGIRKIPKEVQIYRQSFAIEKLGLSNDSIFDVSSTSVVICMTREKAEYLYNNISFTFIFNLKPCSIKLKDIATAGFYTENNEYLIGSNPSKSEPVIQIAADLSVARDLLRSRTDNKKVGIIICEESSVSRSEDDLNDVLKRKKTDFSILSLNISSRYVPKMLKEQEGGRFFSCTKDMILTVCDFRQKYSNSITEKLYKEIDKILDREIITKEITGSFDLEICSEIKRDTHFISNDSYESSEKDKFVMYAFSVLNLFLRSAFTIEDMENTIKKNLINYPPLEERIDQLREWSRYFPTNIKLKADKIIDYFESFYISALDKCPKKDNLISFLNDHADETVAVIVDRKYYITVMSDFGIYDCMGEKGHLYISTPAGFDHERYYDHIIMIGCIEGKRFDPLDCFSADTITVLVYPFEKRLLNRKLKRKNKFFSDLNAASAVPVESDEEFYQDADYEDIETEDIEIVESKSMDLIERLRRQYISQDYHFSGCVSNATAVAIKNARLDSGEVIFFSKHYTAYVYDENEKKIHEIPVDKLAEGDTLIFTSNNDDTKDIVELIVLKRSAEHKFSRDEEECLKLSKHWKNVLRKYKADNGYSNSELYMKLAEQGIPVQKQAVLSWLDEDSHIVAPQNIESLKIIAALCEDEELFDKVEAHYESCRKVKRIRRNILKEIAETVRNKICGIMPDKDSEIYDIYEKLNNQMQISSIEYIDDIEEREIPINKINKPLK